jgi:hypothetical protein
MRSDGDTNSGEPCVVTFLTKSWIAFFDAVLFQDLSCDSVTCAGAGAQHVRRTVAAIAPHH